MPKAVFYAGRWPPAATCFSFTIDLWDLAPRMTYSCASIRPASNSCSRYLPTDGYLLYRLIETITLMMTIRDHP